MPTISIKIISKCSKSIQFTSFDLLVLLMPIQLIFKSVSSSQLKEPEFEIKISVVVIFSAFKFIVEGLIKIALIFQVQHLYAFRFIVGGLIKIVLISQFKYSVWLFLWKVQ